MVRIHEILKSHDAIFNKQECIAIMLLCLKHGHSEHKQKVDVHGYSYTEVWQPL